MLQLRSRHFCTVSTHLRHPHLSARWVFCCGSTPQLIETGLSRRISELSQTSVAVNQPYVPKAITVISSKTQGDVSWIDFGRLRKSGEKGTDYTEMFFITWKCLELHRKGPDTIPSVKQLFPSIQGLKGDKNFADIFYVEEG